MHIIPNNEETAPTPILLSAIARRFGPVRLVPDVMDADAPASTYSRHGEAWLLANQGQLRLQPDPEPEPPTLPF
jgi:hypothetical protein